MAPLKFIPGFVLLLFMQLEVFAQCEITSSNGWTATIDVTPVDAVPSTMNCPWFYHYEVEFNYTVTFTGSTTNRSVSGNIYFNCTGGTGGQPYRFLGTFTSDAAGTSTTTNNTRQYNAVGPAYNYGSNPSCTDITVNDIGCSSYSFSYWGNGVTNGSITCNTGAPLPIDLLNFSADRIEENRIRFKWATASEQQNDYFSIQQSNDNEVWETLDVISGAGNSDSTLHYQHELEIDAKTSAYYRLKQTDIDGTTSESKTVFVGPFDEGASAIRIFPNPADQEVTVSSGNEIIVTDISNITGQSIDLSIYNEAAKTINTSRLENGTYMLRIKNGNEIEVKRFIVSH